MLTGPQIESARNSGEVVIKPFRRDRLGPNSYDVTLGPKLFRYTAMVLDARKEQELEEVQFPTTGLMLMPRVLYLGHTEEVVGVSPEDKGGGRSLVPCLEGKSGVGRLGISIHATAGFGDDGFVGTWTLELSVVQPVIVYPGMLIGQIYFTEQRASFEERRPYVGSYQGQQDPVASKLWKRFR